MKSSRVKLKSIRGGAAYLKQNGILLQAAANGISEFLPKMSNPLSQITAGSLWRSPQNPQVDQITNVTDGNEENVRPPVNQIPRVPSDSKSADSEKAMGRKSIIGSGFRRPDLNSTTLFDPKLLEAFEQAVVCLRNINNNYFDDHEEDNDIVFPDKDDTSLEAANEQRCPPPGGEPEESVVFYTTTLRGIRKTFDDCNMIRFLLDSFKVRYYERDVSMHRQYREELRRISSAAVLPPVLFVKGRCIGGAQSVLTLHEQGKFRPLFEGVPTVEESRCLRCHGFRFLMCDGCRGSRRIVSHDASRIQCLLCNENGLVVCFDCS